MTASIAKALSSTSHVAIERVLSQPRRSAEIIQFPHSAVAEIAEEPAEEAANDNVQEPIATTSPASAVIDRAALTKAVEIADRAVEKRNSIPILSNVRLIATEGGMAISGTDMDIDITVSIDGAVDGHFATTLPAKMMKDLLKKATASDFVAITNGDGVDKLDFERVEYSLQSLPAVDFPTMSSPDADKASTFTMSGADFYDGLDATMGAISTEETRYYMNGIFMHFYEYGDGPQLRMVATDGHRLYRRDFAAPAGVVDMESVIIPRKTVTLLHGMMKGKACPHQVKVEVTANRLRFSFDNITITSKTIDGTFPDYMRVIPACNDKFATFDSARLAEAVRAVTLIASERSRAVKIEMSENSARLSVNNPDSGYSKSDVACQYEAAPVEIGFNSIYLGEILSIAGDNVTVAMMDSGCPALITGDREGFTAVLMPMRV